MYQLTYHKHDKAGSSVKALNLSNNTLKDFPKFNSKNKHFSLIYNI